MTIGLFSCIIYTCSTTLEFAVIYSAEMTREEILEFEREFAEWSEEQDRIQDMEDEFLRTQKVAVAVSEEIYSPYWGAL